MLETISAIDPITIWTFMIAALALNLTPGSDMMLSMATGMQGGMKPGIFAALGISAGSMVHAALAILGLAALLSSHPAAYDLIRYAGAAYLVYLAIQAWRAPNLATEHQPQLSASRAFRRGLIVNIFNPKVAIFFLAFLPQFTDQQIGPVWHQMVFFGVAVSISGFFVNGICAIFAGALARYLKQASGFLNKAASIVFGALAVRLAVE